MGCQLWQSISGGPKGPAWFAGWPLLLVALPNNLFATSATANRTALRIMTAAPRLFLVDDHPLVREGLRQFLEASSPFSVVGEAPSGEEALDALVSTEADLALVDITMRGMSGIELTRRLKRRDPDLRVLIVSTHHTGHYVKAALEAGADGYLVKDKIDKEVEEATSSVLEGHTYVSEGLQQKLK